MKKYSLFGIAILAAFWASAQNSINYEYDSKHQLTNVKVDNGTTIQYTYDAVGNILSKTVTGTTVGCVLTLSAYPSTAGKVNGGGTYAKDTKVTITAQASEGYEFTGWNDGNTDNPRTFTLDSDQSLRANFSPKTFVVTYLVGSQIVYTQQVKYGAPFNLYEYMPIDRRYTFLGWSGEKYDTMPAFNLTYTALIADGIGDIFNDGNEHMLFFDAAGRCLAEPVSGITICVKLHTDGTRTISKLEVK